MKKVNEHGEFQLVASVFIVVIVALVIIFSIVFAIIRSTHHEQVTFKVNKSERVVDRGGKSSRYLVYTDNGVYQNTDSLINGKFDSSDVYNQIQAGHKYSCDVTGWRNGFMSWYPNIVSCKEI